MAVIAPSEALITVLQQNKQGFTLPQTMVLLIGVSWSATSRNAKNDIMKSFITHLLLRGLSSFM